MFYFQSDLPVSKNFPFKEAMVLFARQRTGSTFVSSFFASDADMSYLFEPLNHLNLTASNPTELLGEFLSCNFSRAMHNPSDVGWRRAWMKVMFCKFRDIKRTTGDCGEVMDPNIWHNDCMNRNYMVSKVIRLHHIQDLSKQMEEGLHTVLLLRDPRGVAKSREAIGNYERNKYGVDLKRDAQLYCSNMVDNLWWIKSRYQNTTVANNQLTVLRYEDVVDSPEREVARIYSFLGRGVPTDVTQWIQNVNSGYTSKNEKPESYNIQRQNPRESAWSWRRRMTWQEVVDVQDVCSEFMAIAGYRTMSNVTELRDTQHLLTTEIDWTKHFRTVWH